LRYKEEKEVPVLGKQDFFHPQAVNSAISQKANCLFKNTPPPPHTPPGPLRFKFRAVIMKQIVFYYVPCY